MGSKNSCQLFININRFFKVSERFLREIKKKMRNKIKLIKNT